MKGRYLVAARDIEEKEIILVEVAKMAFRPKHEVDKVYEQLRFSLSILVRMMKEKSNDVLHLFQHLHPQNPNHPHVAELQKWVVDGGLLASIIRDGLTEDGNKE